MATIFAPITFGTTPPLAFRFGVIFLTAGVVPNPVDTLFQKVSGLGATIDTEPVVEGGQNMYVQRLPKRVQHENLVLERGMFLVSPLSIEANIAMSLFNFTPSNVLINLLDHDQTPLASWLFIKAYPVKWSFSDLDATVNSVLIEHLELTYQRMQKIGL